jgi:hypothetical protein
MLIEYVSRRFSASSLRTIKLANDIIAEYEAQGYELTLRQLYYQFVSRDLIPNSQKEYKKLGSTINDARLAGLVSWAAIVDRTRNLEGNSHWEDPASFMESVVPQFQIDKWHNQPCRVEVWIEKDALAGIAERICRKLDVSYFSCRGYTSQSEMFAAGQRLKRFAAVNPNRKFAGGSLRQTPVIIHLGDHDPSGIDMSRDIADRLKMFMGGMEVNRIALNMDQVRKFNPPPNPAKITDSRAIKYIKLHGRESWELDALDPRVLSDLIEKTVLSYRDERKWKEATKMEREYQAKLSDMADNLKED